MKKTKPNELIKSSLKIADYLINHTFNENGLAVTEALSKRDFYNIRQDIALEVVNNFEQSGNPSNYAKLINYYETKLFKSNTLLKEARTYNKVINQALYTAQQIQDKKNRKYTSASLLADKRFKASKQALAGVKYRGDINKASTRKRIALFGEFYNMQNEILGGDLDSGGYVNSNIVADKHSKAIRISNR